jgi:predicted RNase H-like HicB family nuclease
VEYKVIIGWDDENQVFYVVESDIEGLWLEGASFDQLLDKVKDVASELIRHNHSGDGDGALRIFRQVGEPVILNYAA